MSSPGSITYGAPFTGPADVVAAEAVPLELPPAGIGLRILSGLLDVIVYVIVGVFLMWCAFKFFGDSDAALFAAVTTLVIVVALVVIPTAVETYTGGKSAGHYVTGIRTVRDDAGPIGFRHALTRSMLAVIEVYLFAGVPAFLAAVINRKSKRFGDLLAGTYVIRDRRKLDLPVPEPMPPQLERWAAGADLAAIPDGLAVMMRQFLTRRTALRPESRGPLARRLLLQVAPYVSPAPPPAPDEMVLVAVLAERRHRDADRLARDEELRRRVLG